MSLKGKANFLLYGTVGKIVNPPDKETFAQCQHSVY